jgi:hypothetical protein
MSYPYPESKEIAQPSPIDIICNHHQESLEKNTASTYGYYCDGEK